MGRRHALAAWLPMVLLAASGCRLLPHASGRSGGRLVRAEDAATSSSSPATAEPHDPPISAMPGSEPPAAAPALAPAVGPDFGFQGLTLRGTLAPPDPHLAAGPAHLVLITNEDIGFFTKAGQLTFRQAIGGSTGFWGSVGATVKVFDPEVRWDPHSNRFIAFACERDSPVSNGNSYFLVAVSDDADPNGTWYRYRFDVTALARVGAGAGDIDSPNLGLDANALYMTGDFQFQGGKRMLVYIVEKLPLLSGRPPSVTRHLLEIGKLSWGVPVVHGTAPAMYLLEDLVSFGTSAKDIRLHAILDPFGSPRLVSVDLPVTPYAYAGSLTHQGTSVKIATFGSAFHHCVWRNGSLWACHHVDDPVKARWYEIKTNGWPQSGRPAIVQSGTVDLGPAVHTAFNAISVDPDGNALTVFTVGSPSHYLSIGRAWRAAGDPAGTMRPTQIVQANPAAYTIFRWGDYGGVCADPVERNTVWYAHEYAPVRNQWSTWIGRKVLAPLAADPTALSAPQGGPIAFTLDNPGHAGKPYLVLGSISGTTPGIRLGSLRVPINPDLFTEIELRLLNTPVFEAFLGNLDPDGLGAATLRVPPLPVLAGLTMHFAFIQDGNPWDFASNPVRVRLDP